MSTLVRAELLDLSQQDEVVSQLRRIAAPRMLVGGESLAREEFTERAIRDAAVRGIVATGPVITAAAICLVVVFLGFVLGDLVPVRENRQRSDAALP